MSIINRLGSRIEVKVKIKPMPLQEARAYRPAAAI